jgi:hypothetical protein
MKNIHLIPTDRPSRLQQNKITNKLSIVNKGIDLTAYIPIDIYITSDEEIKEGVNQWYLDKFLNKPRKSGGSQYGEKQDVIILTTDQSLDGVQAIDDEFLEWFVKNPSCEFVEVGYGWIRLTETDNEGYWVSIPDKQFEMQQEEPKQETLYTEEQVIGFAEWISNEDYKKVLTRTKESLLKEYIESVKQSKIN